MDKNKSPSIMLLSKFSVPTEKYLNYMKRLEAIYQKLNDTSIEESEKIEFLEEVERITGDQKFSKEEFGLEDYLGYVKRKKAILNKKENLTDNEKKELKKWKKEEKEILNEQKEWNEQIENETKELTGLFSANQNNLDQKDYQQLVEDWQVASQNGSVMWQDVISFSNEFEKKAKLFDEETGEVNLKLIQLAGRNMMNRMKKEMNLSNDTIWVAGVHTNTKHLHIHFATVEKNPTRELKEIINKETGEIKYQRKGRRTQTTLNHMKSTFFNTVLSKENELHQLTNLRNEMIQFIKTQQTQNQTKEIEEIYEATQLIPQGKAKFAYNNQTKETKEKINQLVLNSLENEKGFEQFKELTQQLDEEYAWSYGGNHQGEFFKNQLYDPKTGLFVRCGNVLLKGIKELKAEEKKKQKTLLEQEVFDRLEKKLHEQQKLKEENEKQRNPNVSKPKNNQPKFKLKKLNTNQNHLQKPIPFRKNIQSYATKPQTKFKQLEFLKNLVANEYKEWQLEQAYNKTNQEIEKAKWEQEHGM